MKKFEISEQLANAILQYLASRPYAEVYQLVAALQKIEEIPAKEEQE